MKRLSFVLVVVLISVLFFESCDKVKDLFDGKKEIQYRCTNASGKTATVSYIGEDGGNVFVDLSPHQSWGEDLEFKKGDWVRIQAQSNASTGSLRIEIHCRGCKNIGMDSEKLSAVIDLSQRNIVELSATIE